MSGSPGPRLTAVVTLIGLFGAGCTLPPGFVATLPEEIEREGKAIAVIGDLQQTPRFVRMVRQREESSAEQRRLIDDLAARVDDLGALVIVGDLVYSARSDRDWEHLDALLEPFLGEIPVLPAIGNHDYPCVLIQICRKSRVSRGMLERFPWFSPGQPYAVTSGRLLLLFLDSETELEAQGQWLGARLAEAEGRYAAALVFHHRPAFTNTIDWGAKPDEEVQAHIVPRLEQATLPVVAFNGHVHGFEYIVRNGVHYVITAGGGGPRGPMAEERPGDRYAGPDCPQDTEGVVFRPFNYALLSEREDRLVIDIRGFCRGDTAVRHLDVIEVPL